jgi:hypothetical protein
LGDWFWEMKFFNLHKKQEFFLPSYDGNGIVNLVSSIEKSRGGNPKYPELKILPAKELNSKNVVLMIFDGMGYEYLTIKARERFYQKISREKLLLFFLLEQVQFCPRFIVGVAQ